MLSASDDERTAIRQADIPGRDFSRGWQPGEGARQSPERQLTEPPSGLGLKGGTDEGRTAAGALVPGAASASLMPAPRTAIPNELQFAVG